MNKLTTIKVSQRVRDEIRDAARESHLTQGQLIEELLRERRKARFWESLEAETPDREYLDQLREADRAFDADTEAAIAEFELDQ